MFWEIFIEGKCARPRQSPQNARPGELSVGHRTAARAMARSPAAVLVYPAGQARRFMADRWIRGLAAGRLPNSLNARARRPLKSPMTDHRNIPEEAFCCGRTIATGRGAETMNRTRSSRFAVAFDFGLGSGFIGLCRIPQGFHAKVADWIGIFFPPAKLS